MGLCTFIDVLFVVDPPLSRDGGRVAVDRRMFDLFSFVPRAGVEVFICSSVVGPFQAVEHGDVGASISFCTWGRSLFWERYIFAQVRHWRTGWTFRDLWGHGTFVIGDFNARLPGLALTDGACNQGRWLS